MRRVKHRPVSNLIVKQAASVTSGQTFPKYADAMNSGRRFSCKIARPIWEG
jgi:hypothetical protein